MQCDWHSGKLTWNLKRGSLSCLLRRALFKFHTSFLELTSSCFWEGSASSSTVSSRTAGLSAGTRTVAATTCKGQRGVRRCLLCTMKPGDCVHQAVGCHSHHDGRRRGQSTGSAKGTRIQNPNLTPHNLQSKIADTLSSGSVHGIIPRTSTEHDEFS